jgi:parallel beta-helix repeat protein
MSFIFRQRWMSGGKRIVCTGIFSVLAVATLVVFGASSAVAATSCVDSHGKHGCASTIQAAIDGVSSPNSTITVDPGSYTATCSGPGCSVAVISGAASNGSSLAGLTLQCGNGKGSRSVILDATGLNHAVAVSGVNGVKIAGCLAENASREGILIENSDNVDIANNEVTDNDQAMGAQVGLGTPPCPTFLPPGNGVIQCCPDAFSGGPGGFPNDNDDCGEGIHFRSVTNSVIEGNLVHDNIGGILLTDETGANATNLVTNNTSRDNTKFGGDCGVTLASHIACAPGSNDITGCTLAPVGTPGGVSHNVIDGNLTQNNGASGIGMFANPGVPPGSATAADGNLISNNTVKNNGQPGIAIHVHAENGSANNNVIVGNTVSGNGGDAEATGGGTPPGLGIEVLSNGSFGVPFGAAAPIVGTTISHNSVSNQAIDVWVGNNATDANASFNNLKGKGASGVTNGGTGTVTATNNYWGCPQGPNTAKCASTSGTVLSSPFLSKPPK